MVGGVGGAKMRCPQLTTSLGLDLNHSHAAVDAAAEPHTQADQENVSGLGYTETCE